MFNFFWGTKITNGNISLKKQKIIFWVNFVARFPAFQDYMMIKWCSSLKILQQIVTNIWIMWSISEFYIWISFLWYLLSICICLEYVWSKNQRAINQSIPTCSLLRDYQSSKLNETNIVLVLAHHKILLVPGECLFTRDLWRFSKDFRGTEYHIMKTFAS